jgi:hypothetical protein
LRSGDPALKVLARDALAEAVPLEQKDVFWFASQVSAIKLLYQGRGVR